VKRRLLLLVILPASVFLAAWHTSIPTSAKPLSTQHSALSTHFVGAGSCSASACHNANFTRGHTGSEYTTWITKDPHAGAYEELFSKTSSTIQKKMASATPAHEDQRCLKCHVAPDYDTRQPPPDAPYFKTDGVSCESCHGGAKNWLAVHHLDSWRGKTSVEKKRAGMNDTQSVAGRAQVCVTCHVGAPGMEVDHDLIAAGHPRLHFEFSAFHAFMLRHWPDFKDRDPSRSERGKVDFEARAWLVGQLVTAQASLELLADHAGNRAKSWPEFAEFDCAACHHDLRALSARQKIGFGKRRPGDLLWANHSSLATLALANFKDQKSHAAQAALQEIRKLMEARNPKRETIARNAAKAAALCKALVEAANDAPISVEATVRELLAQTKLAETGDELTQSHLGLSAMSTAYLDLKKPVPKELSKSLLGVSVRDFDPRAFRKRFEGVR
jgi:Cytochrome c554 and c-prime